MYLRNILLAGGCILLLAWGLTPLHTTAQTNDPEFDLALQWMYENNMTKYDTTDTYGTKNWLTREQGAKFFSVFAQNILVQNVTASNDCEFVDASIFDTTLEADIIDACQLGLFKGSQGYFSPKQPLTKAQALTVLIRALEGGQVEEDISPRWKNYFDRAKRLGLTKEVDVWNLDKPVTRYEMALLLYRSVHESIDPDLIDLQELEELLLELGLLKS